MALRVTYLELTGREKLRPAGPPRLADVAVRVVDPPDGRVNAWFYRHVGEPWGWTDHLHRPPRRWQEHAERHETWTVSVGGEPAGYAELRPDGRDLQISYFGLLPAFHGHGLGGHFLTLVLTRGLELADRVWLTTASRDGPHALDNYRARGMEVFRVIG
jgi:ribosomal protein S18 acetylase RimI-like enzyme